MNKVQEIASNGLVLLDRVNTTGKQEALALIELANLLEGLQSGRYGIADIPPPPAEVVEKIAKPNEENENG